MGNKEEAEKKFIELGKAFEILSDKAARAAYDAVIRNRKQRQERLDKLDDKRKRFKEDLEAREKSGKSTDFFKNVNNDEENLKREIDRLRREGSKLLEEEMNIVNQEVKAKVKKESATPTPRIKVTWKAANEFTDIEVVKYLFSKYGDIEIALLNSKKTGAIIEYTNIKSALKVLEDEENLNKKYSVKVTWLGPPLEEKEELKPTVITNNEHSNLSFEEMEAAILKKLQSS